MMRTLRACGVSSRALVTALLTELIALALIAGVLGVLGGSLIASALLPDVAASLRGLYGARVAGRLTLEYDWWLAGLSMAVIGALVAAGASLLKSHRLPVLALAQPDAWREAHQRWLRRQGLIAVLCLSGAFGAFALGQGVTAGFAIIAGLLVGAALALPLLLSGGLRLGEKWADHPLAKWFWADSQQQLPGLSLALMALLLALAVNVGVSTMVEGFRKTFLQWLDQRLAAEIMMQTPTNRRGPSNSGLNSDPRSRPSSRTGAPRPASPAGPWISTDFGTTRPIAITGHSLAATNNVWDRVRAGGSALISEQAARRLGVTIGATVQVPTARGNWPVEIVGVFSDYGNPKGQLRIDVDALLTHWPQSRQTSYAVRAAPEVVPRLIAALRAEFGAGISRLLDRASLKGFSARVFERTFVVTAALSVLTLGVAGVALLTSLLALSNLRLPQLAPIWAVGIPRRRLIQLEILKTVCLTLFTALFSLPLGLLVAWCLVAVVNVQAFGWRLPFHIFPVQWLQLFSLALVAALAASIPPTIRLVRTSPAQLAKVFADER